MYFDVSTENMEADPIIAIVARSHYQPKHLISLLWEICQMELSKEMLIKSFKILMLKESDWSKIKIPIGSCN